MSVNGPWQTPENAESVSPVTYDPEATYVDAKVSAILDIFESIYYGGSQTLNNGNVPQGLERRIRDVITSIVDDLFEPPPVSGEL